MMRVAGELTAEGPGGTILIDARGSSVDVVVQGHPPRPTTGQLAWLARLARDRDIHVTVSDERGRQLAELGARTSSLLGRALVGTSAVRPRLRALLAARRMRT